MAVYSQILEDFSKSCPLYKISNSEYIFFQFTFSKELDEPNKKQVINRFFLVTSYVKGRLGIMVPWITSWLRSRGKRFSPVWVILPNVGKISVENVWLINSQVFGRHTQTKSLWLLPCSLLCWWLELGGFVVELSIWPYSLLWSPAVSVQPLSSCT